MAKKAIRVKQRDKGVNTLVLQNDVDTLVPIGDFEFNNQTLRAFHIDGIVWFVAADVGKILNLSNIRETLRTLDKADVSTTDISSGLQFSRYTITNENVLLTGTLKVGF